MEIKVKRRFKGTDYTIGSLYVNGTYECDTIEDTDRGLDNNMPLSVIQTKKVYGKTAIPTGTYVVDLISLALNSKIEYGLSSVMVNFHVYVMLEALKGF